MSGCTDCPRACGAERENGALGRCRSPYLPRAARAAAHYGEEPCISGTRGSGTIFFTGCSLGCVYCQNREIARGGGMELTVPKLREVMLRLRDTGVHNISLVTASHFVRPIAEALSGLQLGVPVVWNSSGYESVEMLKMLEGLVQIYMPDFKYSLPSPAARYSDAPDYPEVASAAILEMFRQVGVYRMDEDDILRSGVLIRHLILPGQLQNTRGVIDWMAEHFPMGGVLFSLMAQYIPCGDAVRYPEINRRLAQEEYDEVAQYLMDSPIENGFFQELESAEEEYVPNFDLGGVLPPEER